MQRFVALDCESVKWPELNLNGAQVGAAWIHACVRAPRVWLFTEPKQTIKVALFGASWLKLIQIALRPHCVCGRDTRDVRAQQFVIFMSQPQRTMERHAAVLKGLSQFRRRQRQRLLCPGKLLLMITILLANCSTPLLLCARRTYTYNGQFRKTKAKSVV